MPRRPTPPTYRRKAVRGRNYAVVTLTDAATHERRDVILGPYGSPESRQRYGRALADWEAAGRRLPPPVARGPAPAAGPTVADLCDAYERANADRYGPSHWGQVTACTRLFRAMYGSDPVAQVGPNALRIVRAAMVAGDPGAEPKPRKPWSRRIANRGARLLVAVYKWGVARELVPAAAYHAVQTLEPLRAGEAPDPEPVRPVADDVVEATCQHMLPVVRAMVRLQAATGMRPGELVEMRTGDLDRTGSVWTYTPAEHKTRHHGHTRTIYIGPRGQAVLKPWLRADPDAFVFQPAEAVAEQRTERHRRRVTPPNHGNRPGTNQTLAPKRRPGDRYTVASYRRAIVRAADAADREARARAGHSRCPACKGRGEVTKRTPCPECEGAGYDGGRIVPHWHPHQLRHSFGTAVRKDFGIEAARVALGHKHVSISELYAERDMTVGVQVAKAIG